MAKISQFCAANPKLCFLGRRDKIHDDSAETTFKRIEKRKAIAMDGLTSLLKVEKPNFEKISTTPVKYFFKQIYFRGRLEYFFSYLTWSLFLRMVTFVDIFSRIRQEFVIYAKINLAAKINYINGTSDNFFHRKPRLNRTFASRVSRREFTYKHDNSSYNSCKVSNNKNK